MERMRAAFGVDNWLRKLLKFIDILIEFYHFCYVR